jgi:hypothetical protein
MALQAKVALFFALTPLQNARSVPAHEVGQSDREQRKEAGAAATRPLSFQDVSAP